MVYAQKDKQSETRVHEGDFAPAEMLGLTDLVYNAGQGLGLQHENPALQTMSGPQSRNICSAGPCRPTISRMLQKHIALYGDAGLPLPAPGQCTTKNACYIICIPYPQFMMHIAK